MKTSFHAAASVAAGGALWLYTSSPLTGLYTFIAGVFLDIDHIPDFLLQAQLKNKSPGELYREFTGTRLPRLYLFLHSYEFLLLFFTAGSVIGWDERTLGLASGAFLHVGLDQFSNKFKYGLKPYFYFMSMRASKKFRKAALTGLRR